MWEGPVEMMTQVSSCYWFVLSKRFGKLRNEKYTMYNGLMDVNIGLIDEKINETMDENNVMI